MTLLITLTAHSHGHDHDEEQSTTEESEHDHDHFGIQNQSRIIELFHVTLSDQNPFTNAKILRIHSG
ncbi:unnamed protein product [Allacma fusca]|uniref:Uncharacterized protein n=1 Tax=Allacma fusca TaxID=39272 RepID=A0A8J2P7K9_9HEXA|nr:unnamed protein product [Allacma fusca]